MIMGQIMPKKPESMSSQVRPAHAMTAFAGLFGVVCFYTAFVTPPEVAMRFAPYLLPPWVSIG